jgi:hypothetical protein
MNTEKFRDRRLRVHSFLAGIPMHSLDRIELPGGPAGMGLEQIGEIVGFRGDAQLETGALTNGLFALRGLIGRILHWDKVPELWDSTSYVKKLSPEDRAYSQVVPGTAAGISRILYQFEDEMLAEIVNRTVHCFWVMALEPTANGYRLWIAVYVKRLNWFTPVYMALVSPLLKWLIYPSMHKAMKRRWDAAFPKGPGLNRLEYKREGGK